jgi:uncharacterized protein (DUF2461 family)
MNCQDKSASVEGMMINKKQGNFTGFSPETLEFMRSLKANNHKIWFEAHQREYQEYLLQPLRALVADIGNFIFGI